MLIVDDDEDQRLMVHELLNRSGFSVMEASNGKVALDMIMSGPQPALIILDLEMPVMSGFELVRFMRSYERLSTIPVLILSGRSPAEAPEGSPVVRFMNKPCAPDLLVETVRAYIEEGRLPAR